jgi:hypothetical protein
LEGIIWSAFKGRLGTSRGINMGFDLKTLIKPLPGLDALTKPFTTDEINEFVRLMPLTKLLVQMDLMVCF